MDELSEQRAEELLQLSADAVKKRRSKAAFLLNLSGELSDVRGRSANKPPYTINIFERYNADEPTTSWALSRILKYNEGGTYPLLQLFTEKFLAPLGFNPEWIERPYITAEREGRIDVCVKDSKYAILFENKVKGAGYQPNQIACYIHKLNTTPGKHYSRENIFIVLVPCYFDGAYIQRIPTSVWRLPADHQKAKAERRCVTAHDLCWCDYACSEWNEQWDKDFCEGKGKYKGRSCIQTFRQDYEPHTVVLQRELADWLIGDCLKAVPPKEIILKSFVIQLADFLNLQYGTRENQKLKGEMEKFLREKLFCSGKSNIDNWMEINDRLKEVRKLEEEIGNLLESVSRDVIDDWYHELLPVWKDYGLRNEPRKSLGINVQGVWIGCWDGRGEGNHEPYWGFYSATEFTLAQREMIEAILAKTGRRDQARQERNQWYWDYTCHGAERCNDFYNAAVELGKLKKQEK